MALAHERFEVPSFPTPLPIDLIFYEVRDSVVPSNEHGNWEYGQPHEDRVRYPNHELVYVSARREDGKQQWYFAAERNSQDDYNYEIQSGEQLVRTYIIKRPLYRERPVGTSGAPEDEFLYPPAGASSPDAVFAQYCFADDTVVRTERELDSLYVAVRRRFIRPTTVDYIYSQEFRRNIRITKEVIPRTTSSPALGADGTSVEIQDGNHFHSIRITKEIVLGGGETYPYSLPDIPATQDHRFPSKLESVQLVGAWAWARQITAPFLRESYSEDYYFKFKITDPRPGPYSATIKRYITNNPEAIKTANPVTIVPQPIRESIAVTAAWAFASATLGNSTSATAKEWSVPPTIHEEITVTLGGTASTSESQDRNYTTTLTATPNVTAFLALTEATIDYRVREMALGLYEVSVVKLNITGLYS